MNNNFFRLKIKIWRFIINIYTLKRLGLEFYKDKLIWKENKEYCKYWVFHIYKIVFDFAYWGKL